MASISHMWLLAAVRRMRLPLLTALIVCGIVVYLVQVHRDLVAHQALLHELLERVGALQRIYECCPPPPGNEEVEADADACAADACAVPALHEDPTPAPAEGDRDGAESDGTVDSAEMHALLDLIDDEEQQDPMDGEEADPIKGTIADPDPDAAAIDALPFLELKALVKNAGLSTKGSRATLRERILEHRTEAPQ